MGEDRQSYLKVNKKIVEEKLKDFIESNGTVCLGTARQCTRLSGETLALHIHFESRTD